MACTSGGGVVSEIGALGVCVGWVGHEWGVACTSGGGVV